MEATYCGAHTSRPVAARWRYFSGIDATHSPPFSSWQRASSDTMKVVRAASSMSLFAYAMRAAARIQWPRKCPRTIEFGDSQPQWIPSGWMGGPHMPASK